MGQEIELLEHQAAFIESDFIHTAIVGRYRSGKSHAGAIKTMAYPGVDVAYYLPTYGLIKDIAYSQFSHFLSRFKIKYMLNKSDHEYLTPYGKIILRSRDNPDTIIGYEVGCSLIDEADIISILNYFDNRSINASAESFNAKIKNFRMQLGGVKDRTFFYSDYPNFLHSPQLLRLIPFCA
ncbi:transposase [Chryseobacterium potabilaquae]|uniref:Transposase IS204/IS1001/IS1096/IS1165 DDE domain-containing protein n=1 Tax=Chryseobacterium potabilaquae TaxID=2675057 RepID=A0A6N4X3Q1_9FLAO|nr:transposase [Chryseobacterium potabilaquae]CAA7193817.1 hypothetical protein CHRY9293_00228 [Chryseobacterium potabilaquae]